MTFEKDYLLCVFSDGEDDGKNCVAEEARGPEAAPVAELEETPTCGGGGGPVASSTGTGEEEISGGRERGPSKGGEDEDGSAGGSSPAAVLDVPVSSSTDSDTGSSCGSGSSGEATAAPDGSAPESHSHQWRALISGLLQRKGSMRRLSTFPPAAASAAEASRSGPPKRRQKAWSTTQGYGGGEPAAQHLMRWKPTWRNFEYRELAAATNDFSSENLIGKGGHAQVYKGCLPDGQLVAVKRLTRKETEEERVVDFLSELGIIAHVNHPNAAHLLGFGVEGGLHLVLQFSPHGSLASVLHGSKEWIGWGIRFKIALGIAEGLHYLHQVCHRRIIHRDIKASNILLTDNYQPQISDFGLAKWLPEQWTHHVMFPIEGTFGYLAPEYFMHGVVNEKTDVFAYGVLLLELITGRRAVDSSRQSLVIWAKPLLDANNISELVDPKLSNDYNQREMNKAVAVASMCIHHMSTMRPHMDQVLQLLKGKDEPVKFNKELKASTNKPLLFDAGDPEDYTCSRYLNDLCRHKQLALEQ